VTSFPTQIEEPLKTGIFGAWPSIAIDSNDIVYVTWDTADGGSTALNNAIELATIDLKAAHPAFSPPIEIARPGASALWPWVTASNGNASVVWYQYDSVTFPDQTTTGNVSLLETSVFNAASATPTLRGPVDAVGFPIHVGGICQAGTTCVATGQDRRLGDFFTNSLDQNGCVMIATGETHTDPSAATSRPMFIRQTNGTSLTGQNCASPTVNTPESPWMPALVVSAGLGIATAALLRGRRRRAT
jgi:hypothetical protein